MYLISFLLFLCWGLYIIWKKKSPSYEKKWFHFILRIFAAYLVAMILFLVPYSLENFFFLIPSGSGEHYAGVGFLSLATLWGLHFINTGLPLLFSGILRFHKNYNKDNHSEIEYVMKNTSNSILLCLRITLSLGAMIIFYGIWLA